MTLWRFAILFAAIGGALAVAGSAELRASEESAELLGLADAELLAERNSVQLRVLRGERVAAEEQLAARFRDFFPSLTLSYRRNRTVAPRNFDSGDHSVQVSLSQPLYDGGRSNLQYEVAQIDLRLAGERYQEARNQLRFQVREAYLQLIQDSENVRITETSLRSLETQLARVRVERRQGAATELDFQELETEYSRRRLELKQQRDSLGDSLVDFGMLLRLPDPGGARVKRLDLFEIKINDFSMSEEDLYQASLSSRPDVRQARIDLMRSRREYLLQKYDWLPTISLTGNYGRSGEEWPPSNTEWGVGVSVTLRVFGNTLSGDVTNNRSQNETSRGYSSSGSWNVYDNAGWREPMVRAELQLLQARERNHEVRMQAANEVHRLRRAFLDRRTELDIADRNLAIQERRFMIAERRFQNGEMSLQDYLEQELRMVQARLGLVQSRVQLVIAANQLELNLGLELDSQKLVEIRELDQGPLNSPGERSEEGSRGYRTRSNIQSEAAPFPLNPFEEDDE